MAFTNRLGSANAFDGALRNLATRQSNVSNLQENLTSGKKVVRPSDDPTGAAQAERAQTRLARIQSDQRALESQRNAIATAESTLGDITTALQGIRELVVNAGSGANTAAERKTFSLQISGLRDQVVSLANRKDTNGLPLFGALGSALAPFVGPLPTAPDYTYQGLPGQVASTEVSIPYTLDGDSAFMNQAQRDGSFGISVSTIPAPRTLTTDTVSVTSAAAITGSKYQVTITNVGPGATTGTSTATYDVVELPPFATPPFTPITGAVVPDYPSAGPVKIAINSIPGISFNINGKPAAGDTVTIAPKASIFSVLDDAVRDIGGAINANAANQAVAQALNNIDIGMAKVSAVRGQAGDLLNRADRITDDQSKRSIQLEGDRSRAEDLDMIDGLSKFQNQQTGYQAALQSYAQIQKLSLFNYIS